MFAEYKTIHRFRFLKIGLIIFFQNFVLQIKILISNSYFSPYFTPMFN